MLTYEEEESYYERAMKRFALLHEPTYSTRYSGLIFWIIRTFRDEDNILDLLGDDWAECNQ